jgi:hypothetical protein
MTRIKIKLEIDDNTFVIESDDKEGTNPSDTLEKIIAVAKLCFGERNVEYLLSERYETVED